HDLWIYGFDEGINTTPSGPGNVRVNVRASSADSLGEFDSQWTVAENIDFDSQTGQDALGMRTRGGWYTVRNNWFHNQIGSIRGSTLTYFGRGLKMRIPSKDVDVVGNIFWNIGNNPIQRREHAQDEPHSVNITGNTIICDR